jgi:hypothetical protein
MGSAKEIKVREQLNNLHTRFVGQTELTLDCCRLHLAVALMLYLEPGREPLDIDRFPESFLQCGEL